MEPEEEKPNERDEGSLPAPLRKALAWVPWIVLGVALRVCFAR